MSYLDCAPTPRLLTLLWQDDWMTCNMESISYVMIRGQCCIQVSFGTQPIGRHAVHERQIKVSMGYTIHEIQNIRYLIITWPMNWDDNQGRALHRARQWQSMEWIRKACKTKFDRTHEVSMIARNRPEELDRKALRDHIETTTPIHEFSQFSLKDQYVGIFNIRQNMRQVMCTAAASCYDTNLMV